MKNRSYRKINKRYWNGDHYFNGLGYLLLFSMFLMWLWVSISKMSNNGILVSPVYVPEAMASEVVSCETAKGYLECKAYAGKITWEQYDRISKIIQCESSWNADAMHVNKNGSVDLGLVQINSIHKNISNADKLDYKKAIDWMIAKVDRDGGYHAWVCNRYIK